MSYFFHSIRTLSFWRYALFSQAAALKLLATVGALYTFMEIMDFLNIYTKDQYSKYAIFPIIFVAIIYVIVTRRPVSRISYKVPKRDLIIEVKIADLFVQAGDIVVSSSTTFDTDISNGLISPDSLQGQLALKFFQGNTTEIDRQLTVGLSGIASTVNSVMPGKQEEYPMGTVVKITSGSKIFYFFAMSRFNAQGNASSTTRDVEESLEKLWQFIANQGNLKDIAVPLIGTGRGRLDLPRKKMVEKIAQSFADASKSRVFCNKLTIVVHPSDADRFEVNLFEVRDYLVQSLHF